MVHLDTQTGRPKPKICDFICGLESFDCVSNPYNSTLGERDCMFVCVTDRDII